MRPMVKTTSKIFLVKQNNDPAFRGFGKSIIFKFCAKERKGVNKTTAQKILTNKTLKANFLFSKYIEVSAN